MTRQKEATKEILIDYNRSVTSVLEEHDHPYPNKWFEEFISLQENELFLKDRKWHRFLINEYWRAKLSEIDLSGNGSTILSRAHLMDECDDTVWLSYFNSMVAPDIIKFKIGF